MKQIVAASIPTTKQVRKGCWLAICSVSIITLPTFPYSGLLVVTSLRLFSKRANKKFHNTCMYSRPFWFTGN